jgi:1-acyl-sn-glycerol-3-phosphate acyltransferase
VRLLSLREHLYFAAMSPRGKLWYRFIRWVARHVFFGLLGGMRSFGEEHVPMEGGVLVAPVHFSYLDPEIVACGTKRAVSFMAKQELFKVFGLGWLIRSLDAFPVKRGENDTEAIRHALELLKAGHAVLLFPEGTRGLGKVLGPMSPGIALLAKKTGAQVLPVGIIGTHIVWPKGSKKLRRHRMKVLYGPTFTYADVATGSNEKENREKFALELSRRLIELCRQGGLELEPSPATATLKARIAEPQP